MSDIGVLIRKRRGFLKLTQSELAQRAGISLRSLKSIEYGTGNPAYGHIEKVLDVLGMKLAVVIK